MGHLSYLLLVFSMLMRRMLWLRLFVTASAVAGVLFDGLWLQNWVGVFWQTLLVIVNLAEMFILWRNDRRAIFSPEEELFRTRLLKGLSPGQARSFLDRGRWETLAAGSVLTREGTTPEYLSYIASGEVRVETGRRLLRVVECGHFIGEMSLMGDDKATATTRMQTEGRVWRIERPKIDRLRETTPAVMSHLEAAFARDMRAKIVFQNAQGGETA